VQAAANTAATKTVKWNKLISAQQENTLRLSATPLSARGKIEAKHSLFMFSHEQASFAYSR
jgi:hypothetical protein